MGYNFIAYTIDKAYEIDFSTIEEFKDLNPHSLEDIISFTNSFENAEELISFLKANKLIDLYTKNINLGISYKKAKEDSARILRYGISYKKNKLLFKQNVLIDSYIRSSYDVVFLKTFLKRYYDYYKNVPHFNALLMELYASASQYNITGSLQEGTGEIMGKFIKKVTTKKTKNGEKEDIYSIREFAMFLIDYRRKRNAKEKLKEDAMLSEEEINDLKLELMHYKDMLKNSALNDEQVINYESHVSKLQQEIERGSR